MENKKTRFERRFDFLLRLSRKRLRERLRRAYFHGYAPSYLERIHFAQSLEKELMCGGDLSLLEQAAERLLEERLRGARRGGYLVSLLGELEMQDLILQQTQRKKERFATKRMPLLMLIPSQGAVSSPVTSEADTRPVAKLYRVK